MKPITKNLNVCGIYMITNLINGKRYIGSSVNIRQRLWTHRSNLRHNHHSNPHLQASWNKYGEEYFDYCILEVCNEEDRFDREQHYVDTLKPEYNICVEIVQNPPITEETRKKHSETRKLLIASGRIPITNNTPVYVYQSNGSFVGYWKSIRQAAKAIGIHYSSACRCIQGLDFQNKGFRFFRELQPNMQPFSKPKNFRHPLKWFSVINTETGETVRLKGREEVAKFLGTTSKTVGIYIGGKHKYARKYMIYSETAH